MENKKSTVNIDKLEAKCRHLTDREVKSAKAERDSIKYMQCIYMSERIGKVYEGIVSSVMEYGIFVEIKENSCEGLIRTSEIGYNYVVDTNNYRINNVVTGESITLGDKVHVVVSSVDIEKKNINLSLIKL